MQQLHTRELHGNGDSDRTLGQIVKYSHSNYRKREHFTVCGTHIFTTVSQVNSLYTGTFIRLKAFSGHLYVMRHYREKRRLTCSVIVWNFHPHTALYTTQ